MKNFSDQDSWDELVKRMGNYSEQPDDAVWNSISDKLRPSREERWFPWIERGGGLVILMLFSFLVGTSVVNISQKEIHSTDLSRADQVEKSLQASKEVFRAEPDTSKQLEVFVVTPAHSYDAYANAQSVHTYVGQKSPVSFVIVDNDPKMNGAVTDFEKTSGEQMVEMKADTVYLTKELVAQADNNGESGSIKEMSGEEKKARRKHNLRIYGQFSPMIAFQRVSPTSRDGIVIKEIMHRSLFSSDRFAYGFEAGVQAPLTPRLEYYAGVSFYRQSQRLHYRYQSDRVAVETTNDNEYFVTPVEGTATVNYKMTNVGANAGIIYSFYGKRLKHQAGLGIGYQQGIQRSSSEKYQNDKSLYLSGRIFYRNELMLSRRMSVYLQPSFDHGFYVDEKLNAPFKLKPYSISVGFGVLYSF